MFAIVITLLGLDLKVPRIEGAATMWALAGAPARQWPSYLAFITNFFTVLIMWVIHHGMLKLMFRVNSRLLFANGFLLLFSGATPFTTELLSEYFQKPGAEVACAVYAGTFVFISLGDNLTCLSVSHQRALLRNDASQQAVRRITRNYTLGLPLHLSAVMRA